MPNWGKYYDEQREVERVASEIEDLYWGGFRRGIICGALGCLVFLVVLLMVFVG
jgi:hypothetical protein